MLAAAVNELSAMRARRRISTLAVVVIIVISATQWTLSRAQEYLPPKTGGGGKKPENAMPANYDFSYEVQDSGNSVDFGHNEKMKDGTAIGSYHVLLPDGRMQLVEYIAGPDGFKPVVTYMGEAVFPPAPPREEARAEGGGYRYSKAASNRQSVRQPAPKPPPAQTTTPADPPMD